MAKNSNSKITQSIFGLDRNNAEILAGSRGLDLSNEPKTSKQFQVLENVRFNRLNAIEKRKGWNEWNDALYASYIWPHKEGFLGLSKDGQMSLYRAGKTSKLAPQAIIGGSAVTETPFLDIQETPILAEGLTTDDFKYAFGTAWSTGIYATVTPFTSGSTTHILRVYDTQNVLIDSLKFNETGSKSDTVQFLSGEGISGLLCYYSNKNTGQIYVVPISSTGSISSPVAITSAITNTSTASVPSFSAVLIGDYIRLFYVNDARTAIVCKTALAATPSTVVDTGTLVSSLTAVSGLTAWVDTDEVSCVYAYSVVDGANYKLYIAANYDTIYSTIPTLVDTLATTDYHRPTITGINRPGDDSINVTWPANSSNERGRIFYSIVPTGIWRVPYVKTAFVYTTLGGDKALATGSPYTFQERAILASYPFAYTSSTSFLVALHSESFGAAVTTYPNTQKTTYVVTDRAIPVGKIAENNSKFFSYLTGASSGYPSASFMSPQQIIPTSTSNKYRFHFVLPTGSQIFETRFGFVSVENKLTLVELQIPYADNRYFGSLIRGRSVLFGSAMPFSLADGYYHEQGFNTYPAPISAATGPGGAGASLTAGQLYSWRCVYEYVDNEGNITFSAPTPTAATYTPSTVFDAYLTVPNPTFTVNNMSSDVYQSNVNIAIYRTVGNGTTFYREKTVAATSTSTQTITVGTLSDASLAANETLYTEGGLLDNTPPPAYRVCVRHKDRIYVVPRNKESSLAYSLQILEGETPAFNEVLTVDVPGSEDRITALVSLNNSLYALKRNAIYRIDGDPATANGTQSTLEAVLITDAIGCTDQRSVAYIPGAVIFAGITSIYKLNSDGSYNDIGTDIRYLYRELSYSSTDEYYQSYIIGSAVIPKEGIVLMLPSVPSVGILVYNYEKDVWSVDKPSNQTAYCQALCSSPALGGIACKLSDAAPAKASYYDPNLTSQYYDKTTNYSVIMETGWITPTGLNGWFRLHEIQLIGYLRGTCGIQVLISYDYDDTATDILSLTDSPYATLDYDSLISIQTGSSSNNDKPFNIRLQGSRTKMAAYKLAIIETLNPGFPNTKGFSIVDIRHTVSALSAKAPYTHGSQS